MNFDLASVPIGFAAHEMSDILSGLDRIVGSYISFRDALASQRYSYPFSLGESPAGFDRGQFSADAMNIIVELRKRLRFEARADGVVLMNAMELRAAIFAVRVNLEWWKYQQFMGRRCDAKTQKLLGIDEERIGQRSERAGHTIHSIERQFKRANKTSSDHLESLPSRIFLRTWRAHIRWVQLYLVYFKPAQAARKSGKKQYRDILNELENLARVTIADRGYEPPPAKKLRPTIRQFISSSLDARCGNFDVDFMLRGTYSEAAKSQLVGFILNRSNLIPVQPK